MRTIEHALAFKKDYKRAAKGKYGKSLDRLLLVVLENLVSDLDLPVKYRDHDLIGNWAGYRECHLKPDLLLIYSKPDDKTLRLARIGSQQTFWLNA